MGADVGAGEAANAAADAAEGGNAPAEAVGRVSAAVDDVDGAAGTGSGQTALIAPRCSRATTSAVHALDGSPSLIRCVLTHPSERGTGDVAGRPWEAASEPLGAHDKSRAAGHRA